LFGGPAAAFDLGRVAVDMFLVKPAIIEIALDRPMVVIHPH
jgi:hypothetical protein